MITEKRIISLIIRSPNKDCKNQKKNCLINSILEKKVLLKKDTLSLPVEITKNKILIKMKLT